MAIFFPFCCTIADYYYIFHQEEWNSQDINRQAPSQSFRQHWCIMSFKSLSLCVCVCFSECLITSASPLQSRWILLPSNVHALHHRPPPHLPPLQQLRGWRAAERLTTAAAHTPPPVAAALLNVRRYCADKTTRLNTRPGITASAKSCCMLELHCF